MPPALCGAGVTVQFPKFYGYSHVTFEPLKNSYQTFQMTVQFKVIRPFPYTVTDSSFVSQSML